MQHLVPNQDVLAMDSRLGTRVGLARRRDSPMFRIFVKILRSFGSLALPKMVPPSSSLITVLLITDYYSPWLSS